MSESLSIRQVGIGPAWRHAYRGTKVITVVYVAIMLVCAVVLGVVGAYRGWYHPLGVWFGAPVGLFFCWRAATAVVDNLRSGCRNVTRVWTQLLRTALMADPTWEQVVSLAVEQDPIRLAALREAVAAHRTSGWVIRDAAKAARTVEAREALLDLSAATERESA